MTRIGSRIAFAILTGGILLCSTAWANQHVRFPEDVLPDFYTSTPIEALHNDEWAVIPFWRPPECIRADFNLLRYFDAAAVNCPLLVVGFAEFNDVGPTLTEARGLGAVPIWFVRWSELQAATADRVLTIGELASLPSLLIGTADIYNEQNHIYRIHEVSHFALVGHGTLQDGRTMDVQIVEVDLELIRVFIQFD
jgi:hypothetical protein